MHVPFIATRNIPVEATWFTIGRACQLLQVLPDQFVALMDEMELEFDQSWDDIPVLRGDKLLKVSRQLNAARKALEDAQAKTEAAADN